MHPLTAVIVRWTANTTMALGALLALLAGWDYVQGPGAGRPDTLWIGLIGLLVFLAGFRSFRRLAAELEAAHERSTGPD